MKALPALALGICIGAAVTYGFTHGGMLSDRFASSSNPGSAGAAASAGSTAARTTGNKASLFPNSPLSDANWWASLEAGGEKRSEALRTKMVELLGIPHLSQRKRLFGALLEHYEPGDLEAIHRGMIDREKMGGRFDQEFEMMMERAAEVDGELVMEKAKRESLPTGSKMHDWHARCMANWGAAESAQAVAWWNELPDGKLRDHLSRPLIEGLARVDLENAWKAAQMFEPDQRSRFAANFASQFAKTRGLDKAVEWVAGLGPDEVSSKSNALRELTNYMHQIAPAKQAELFARFASEPWVEGSGVFEGVAQNWARRNGEDAAVWAQTLPEAIRDNTARAAVGKWTAKDPDAAGKWLQNHKADPAFIAMADAYMNQLKVRQSPDIELWRERLRPAGAPPL